MHRSWTGKGNAIERLRCMQCGQEFSARRGTLMEATKLPEATVERRLKCQRWGVCDTGTADSCAVDLKTVHRFQQVASQRAQEHPEQVTQALRVEGVQLDEMPSKLRRRRVEWLHTAIALGRWFVWWVHWGPRTQASAATRMAQVVARLNWEPPIVRELFEKQKVEQDPQKRREILKELVRFLVPTDPNDPTKGYADNHWVTLFWGRFFWMVDERIQGFNAPQTVQYGFKHDHLWRRSR